MIFRDPLELFRASVERMSVDDFVGAAALCDPVSLRAFHRDVMRMHSEPTVVYPDPTGSQDPTEGALIQQRARNDRRDQLARMFPSLTDPWVLDGLTADAVYAAYLDGQSPRRQLEWQVAKGYSPTSALDRWSSVGTRWPLRAVGCAGIDEPIAHIVFVLVTQDEANPGAARAIGSSAAVELQRRFAVLPSDEQQFARDRERSYHPQTIACRRQPDGGWLLVADWQFLGHNASWIGFEETEATDAAATE